MCVCFLPEAPQTRNTNGTWQFWIKALDLYAVSIIKRLCVIFWLGGKSFKFYLNYG